MNLEKMKEKLLEAKELRAKSRGRLEQLLDTLRNKYGVGSLVEARGKLVDIEKERDKLRKEVLEQGDKLEKEVNEFFRTNEDSD